VNCDERLSQDRLRGSLAGVVLLSHTLHEIVYEVEADRWDTNHIDLRLLPARATDQFTIAITRLPALCLEKDQLLACVMPASHMGRDV
jgi:hypothetical protein